MDQEMEIMEDLVVDEPSFSDYIDPEYEFDASQFFDFTRDETESQAQEAESWFQYAHEYPPSPFIVKLKLMKAAKVIPMKAHKTSSRKIEADRKTSSSTSSVSDGDIGHASPSREVKIKGVKHHNLIPQDSVKAKSKSTVNLSKLSESSFMKPTASHLAKQNKECDMHPGSVGRLQKPLVNAVEKLRTPARFPNHATKRQKLEVGYLRKVAQLKHRASFLHKSVKKAEGNSNSRLKTTAPQKPVLVTEERAHRRRSLSKSESDQQPKANPNAFKARQLNRKILDAPKLPQRMKSMTHLTDFQEFHLKTRERALQIHSANALHKQNSAPPMSEDIVIKRQNSENAGKKDKCRSQYNLKACTTDKVHPIKDGGFILNAKHNSQLPPIELFKKLSLKSELETKIVSSLKPHLSKALKENAPRSLKQQEFRRCGGKSNQWGSDRKVTEQPNTNRSMDIMR